jgi:hypothetical protein
MPNVRSLSTNYNARLWNNSILPSFSLGQVDQIRTGFNIDPARLGDLDYRTGNAPWLAWGPYLWANGALPREGWPNLAAERLRSPWRDAQRPGGAQVGVDSPPFVLIYRCMSQQAPRKRASHLHKDGSIEAPLSSTAIPV